MGSPFDSPRGAMHFDPTTIRLHRVAGHQSYEQDIEAQYRRLYPQLHVEHNPAIEIVVGNRIRYVQPDLLLSLPTGQVLLAAECKYKNRLTARDVKQAERYRRLLNPGVMVIYYPARCRVSKKIRRRAARCSITLTSFA
jgi:hypothetical protein